MSQKISLLLLSAVAHAAVVPLSGAVLRYRAHASRSVLASYGLGFLRVLRRTYEFEGWEGLFKGVIPTFLGVLIFRGSLMLVKVHPTFPLMVMAAPQINLIESPFFILISSMIEVPAQIVLVRTTLTNYKIPWYNPILALRLLFSPSERQSPWIIYLTPGLMLSLFLQYAMQFFVIRLSFLLGSTIWNNWSLYETQFSSPSMFGLFVILGMLGISLAFLAYTVLLTPLKVICTRLAQQRNWITHEGDQFSEADEAEVYGLSVYSVEETVCIHDASEPYSGFIDCYHRIVEQEGWRALYRGWWYSIASQAVLLLLWMS
ncbi:hypothetical protein K435DRAFT_776853 [Dendrothele bispora CBS 962.96]|uniref:Mitochondrial carrier n=1 Tax=Dendrothele bispora (strain CBS 962.96) TaxID=1314807 RepID=A0A4S8MBD6_DENBC|nr:hypothetical protein K435DRAFT_776853 [Dendrothele bispora CBS 962.96]